MRILHVMASRANGGAETYSTDMMASLQRGGRRADGGDPARLDPS